MKELKSNNEFDKMFHDRLKGDSIPPSDKVWDGIESRLDEPKKPKIIFWLSSFVGLLLIGTTCYWMLNHSNPSSKTQLSSVTPKTDQPSQNNNTDKTQIKLPASDPNSVKEEVKNNDDKSLANNSSTTASPEEIKTNTALKNTTSTTHSTTDHISEKKIKNGSSTTEKENTIAKPKVIRNKKSENANEKTSDKTTSAPTESASSIGPAPEEKTKETKKSKNSEKNISSPVTLTPVKQNDVAPTDTKTEPQKGKETSNAITAVPIKQNDVTAVQKKEDAPKTIIADSSENKKGVAQTIKPSPKKDSIIVKDPGIAKKDTAVKKETLARIPSKMIDSSIQKTIPPYPVAAIYAYFSPDVFLSKASSNERSFNPSSESHFIKYSAGVKAEYRPCRIIGIQIGCGYSELQQKQQEETIHFSKYITTPYSFYSSLGEMKVDPSVMKQGFYMMAPTDSFKFNTTSFQTVKFLNIPVNIKLNLLKKRFNVFVDAGINMQIVMQQYSTLNIIKENFTTTLEYTDVKINRFNYSALIGLGAEYNIYKKLGIFIEPSIRYGLNNMSKVSGITNKPILFGVNGGVCIYL